MPRGLHLLAGLTIDAPPARAPGGGGATLAPNVRRLYLFSFLKMTLFPMAVITLFWKDQIGLSLTEIMAVQGIFSLATLAAEYPSGYLSDRLGYRFSLSLASVAGILGWGLYTLAGSLGEVIAAELLLALCYAFISGADSALLYESLVQAGEEHRYARYDGRMAGFAQAGEAAGALFAGLLYAFFPRLPMLLQVGVWFLALALARTLVEPPVKERLHPGEPLAEAARIGRETLLRPGPRRAALLLAAVLGVASFFPVWLIQPHMQEQGVPLTWFGPIWAGANLTVALFSFLSFRCHAWLGTRGSLILFVLLTLAGYGGLGMAAGTFSFLFYYLLTAMRGLQGPLLRSVLLTKSRPGERASVLSLKSLLFRMLFVAFGPAIGLLADGHGLPVAFLVTGAAFLLLLPLLIRAFLKHERRPLGTA